MIFNEKNLITGVFLWIKDPDPVFSRIRVTQKDRIRPDPDPQHCFKLYFISKIINIKMYLAGNFIIVFLVELMYINIKKLELLRLTFFLGKSLVQAPT